MSCGLTTESFEEWLTSSIFNVGLRELCITLTVFILMGSSKKFQYNNVCLIFPSGFNQLIGSLSYELNAATAYQQRSAS